ncbi:hypothetical protein BU24DRAFT_112172 [Aaosphaeria arxii CBS 175.79]|uniref:Uncharacterized protein n=1 Tax=Aaosphaeria arxii CBS 175.79 TaxID=1450172 RepID=A0A6A5Y1D7_9PLEO|nr:uncharacterized protein BU24DRAFT_112172 [Aaosphaeria arxii CBS 175.79]KAF2019079.1 hypothetical protein BU24DRAFT_112172 [Aaosphaeria arxii CBS 175.79]
MRHSDTVLHSGDREADTSDPSEIGQYLLQLSLAPHCVAYSTHPPSLPSRPSQAISHIPCPRPTLVGASCFPYQYQNAMSARVYRIPPRSPLCLHSPSHYTCSLSPVACRPYRGRRYLIPWCPAQLQKPMFQPRLYKHPLRATLRSNSSFCCCPSRVLVSYRNPPSSHLPASCEEANPRPAPPRSPQL